MKAGFGKAEIVFPIEMLPTESFCAIHDNPHVRMMYIESATDLMALAVIELVNVPEEEIAYTRTVISEMMKVPYENVWVQMTHAIATPHNPGPMGPPDKRPPLTERHIEQRKMFSAAIRRAVDAAALETKADIEEAKLGWGNGYCDANQNRDIESPWGWWIGVGGEGYSNKDMKVMKVENLAGKVKGLYVNYAVKPCAIDNAGMKTGTRQISSECCGFASLTAEEAFGAPVLYTVAAAGDQVTKKTAMIDSVENGQTVLTDLGVETGFACAEEVGKLLSDSIISIAASITAEETNPKTGWESLSFDWETVGFGGRRVLTKEFKFVGSGKKAPFTAELFRLGDAILVADRPETLSQTEKELIAACPVKHMCLMVMVNGEKKYLPDMRSCQRGTWEAQSTFYMPGVAEKFVEEAARCMEKLA